MTTQCNRIFAWEKYLPATIVILLGIGLVFNIISWGRYIYFDGLQEVREFVNIQLVENICSGTYFSMESFPQNLYLYGPLQGAILSLLPQRTIHINRIISCVSLAICVFPIFIITRNILHRKPKTLTLQAAISVTLFIYTITLDDFYRNSGRPDQIGLFLSFCAMAIVFTDYYSYLSPKWRGIVAVIITVLALLTKQYYGVVLIVFLLHEFFHEKNVYFFITSLTGIILFFICTYLYAPIYFLSYFHHVRVSSYSYSYALYQLVIFIVSANIFFITLFYLPYGIIKNSIRVSLNTKLFSVYSMIIFCLLMFKLGGHEGNFLVYYNELLAPCVLILFLFTLAKFSNETCYRILALSLIMFLSINIYHSRGRAYATPEHVKTASFSQKSFLCPTSFSNDPKNIPDALDIDTGQLEYIDTIKPSDWLSHALPKLQQIKPQIKKYDDAILNNLALQKYDEIYVDPYCIMKKFKHSVEMYYKTESESAALTKYVKK